MIHGPKSRPASAFDKRGIGHGPIGGTTSCGVTYSYRWTGRSRNKIVIALGVQFAYTSVPPDLFTIWSEGQGMGMGSCRPMTIRVGLR